MLTYFFTIPVHELFHLLTFMIYGNKLKWYSAGAVDAYVESYESMPMFPLRIILSITGSLGIVVVFFILNHMSYYFIEGSTDQGEKLSVAFRLHLLMLIIGFPAGMIVTVLSPAVKSGELSVGLGLLYNMMWIPFFWGFMFTGVMNVLPPKKSRFLYKLPEKPNWVLLAAGIALILIDICVFGPGIRFG